MINFILSIIIMINLMPSMSYGAWLDQFFETKQYAHNTIRYLRSLKREINLSDSCPVHETGRQGEVSRKRINILIRQASQKYSIHPDFIRAVISAESDFKNNSLSHKGAMGLMQLMPETCKDMGVSDPWNPQQNIMGGTRYLKSLLAEFRNPYNALAAYNFGPGKVRRKIRWPEETRIYVFRVMKKYTRYRRGPKIGRVEIVDYTK